MKAAWTTGWRFLPADVNLNPVTPPGRYTLAARVMAGETRLTLDGAGGNDVTLTSIEITD